MNSKSKPLHYRRRNLRDIGGAPGRSGNTVRTGLIYRSAQLDDLTPAEARQLTQLHVSVVVDLRHEVEKAPASRQVSAVMPHARLAAICLSDLVPDGSNRSAHELLAGLKTAGDARAWMIDQFADTVRRRRPQLIEAVGQVIDNESGASLFFCVAGKDRTGIVAAVLLMALGVPRSFVAKDFDLTNQRLASLPLAQRPSDAARRQYDLEGVPRAVVDALADAHPLFLDAVYRVIEGEFGGIDDYLGGDGLLDVALLADFRRRLLAR